MTILYKNTPVYFEVFGEGETIVLLHGFLESSEIWKTFVPELSETNQVILIDLFGHGKTGKVAEIHSMEEMAEAVAKILNVLKCSSASFVGHSMGGYVALAVAELFSEKIKTLLLLNSTSQADSEERQKERDRSIKLLSQNKKIFIRMAIANLFAPKSHEKFAKEIDALVKTALAIPTENIIASIKGMKIRKDRSFVLKEFEGRKILFAGKWDPIIPFEKSEEVAAFSKCVLIALPGGHMGFIENKDFLFSEMKDLFQ